MATEIKDWLDLDDAKVRAKLAKELIALANHGGGYLLFGFSEATTGWAPSGACPHNFVRYSQDAINDIAKRHAEPVFECHVHHLDSSAGDPHVVIEVPGGHIAPIRANRSPQGSGLTDHTYYIRRPGPESAPPQNGREWEALIRRCVDNDHERQVEAFRRILAALRAEPGLAQQVAESAVGSAGLLKQWTEASLDRLRSLDDGSA
jgi:predicted HTH transcriptional regulator